MIITTRIKSFNLHIFFSETEKGKVEKFMLSESFIEIKTFYKLRDLIRFFDVILSKEETKQETKKIFKLIKKIKKL